ncbi:MAG TPA: hypothetical protein PKC80_08090 [Burkholderiaceae bacterium]|mgnify:CR=1 FL=1|nr:hypothetical protein [Burkholderiaceae bacterium]
MALRIKSQWYQNDTAKTPIQTASAMAFITWRVAQNTLKQMRLAQFDIDIGAQYFAFTREVLVFLIQVLDRMAHDRMNNDERSEFITALVIRIGEILQENEDTMLGAPATGQPSHFDEFINLYNELADHYAEFGHDEAGPDFNFIRYLGHRIEAIMPAKDQRWVIDQMMATEVPEAVDMLQRGMKGVLSTEPRPARPERPARPNRSARPSSVNSEDGAIRVQNSADMTAAED